VDDTLYDRPGRPGEEDPTEFFSSRGYALRTHESGGVWSADLLSAENPDFVVAASGRSSASAERAELAAMRRWIVEQAT